jgi:hypothetical protein
MNKERTHSLREFADNFNHHFQYRPSDLRVMRTFLPLVDKTDALDIKKLKDFKFIKKKGIYIPNAIKPIVKNTSRYKKIPFEQIYEASKFIADRISPNLRRHLVSMYKNGKIVDEEFNNEFDDELWEVHIDNTYTADDIISVLHEMGHEICLQHNILSEVPSITTEFLADKIIGKYGIQMPCFTTAKRRRIKNMINDGYELEFIAELFEEYEKNGKKMTPEIAGRLEIDNINALKEGMNDSVPYFIGSASSLVLADNIRDADDYDEVIDILSNRNIGKLRKLKELNITAKTLENSLIKNSAI